MHALHRPSRSNSHLPESLQAVCTILALGLLRLRSRTRLQSVSTPTEVQSHGDFRLHSAGPQRRQGEANDARYRRLPAGEIEAVVMGQVRAVLRQPEIVVGTWREALAGLPDLTEADVRDALGRLDPLWDELFPAEQERIVRLLVERVVVSEAGAEITLKLDGIAGLARDLMSRAPELRRAA